MNTILKSNSKENWVLFTLLLSSVPSLFHLPGWVTVISLLGGGLHYARWAEGTYGKLASALLLAAIAVGIHFSFDSWFSGDAVLSFFIGIVFLKWGESRTRRDYLLLMFAAVILAAVGSLYWESLLNLLHMFVVVLALTISLLIISAGDQILRWKLIVRRTLELYLLAIPIMVLLFLTFPRIPGPLWDIGLAFGLPVKALMEKNQSGFGGVKVLKPGGIHRLSQDNGNVLVAQFQGAVPYKNRLYWRGPVFWDYDGDNWHLPEGWDNRGKLLKRAIRSKQRLERELRWNRHPVRYSLRVMPNGGRWLFGLEVPAASAPESFISDEYQLLSIRKIDDHEPKLEMLSYLDYGIGEKLTVEQRKKGLAWPGETNPRLHLFGEQLRKDFEKPEEILFQAYKHLATNNFQFDSAKVLPTGPDVLDRFFFDEKSGGAEYLAGSFVLLLRAAGIPARLVSGFRGGTVIALTNFVIVKQSNAHAWVEAWFDNKGWIRVEPKDIVLPPEKPATKENETAKQPTPEIQVRQAERTQSQTNHSTPSKTNTDMDVQLPKWMDLFGGIQKWVIDYDPDRQVELLKSVGVKNTNWKGLLTSALVGVLLLSGLFFGFWKWQTRRRFDPVISAYQQYCNQLEKIGLSKKANECPRDFLNRLVREHSEYAIGAGDITERYIAIRYGREQSPEAVALFQRQVKRFTSMI